MKKRFNTYFPTLFVISELVILAALIFINVLVNNGLDFLADERVILSLLFLWGTIITVSKDYVIGRAISSLQVIRRALLSVFLFVSAFSIYNLFSPKYEINSLPFAVLIISFLTSIILFRVSTHLVLDKYRAFGGNIRRSIIVGYDDLGFNLYKLLIKRPQFGIRVKGFLSTTGNEKEQHSFPLLGTIDELFNNKFEQLDFIYLSDKLSNNEKSRIVNYADENLIKVKLLPDIKLDVLKSLVLRRYEYISVIDLNQLPLDGVFNRVVKRAFDLVFSSIVILLVMSWLYPIIGLLIKLDSKGPVIFKQDRHGENNDIFSCFKFRTMVKNDMADEKWATKDDYRVTKVGRFLRRTSIDELPQIFNVLFGQMSIVGPRPHPIKLNESYQAKVQKYANRHSFKPGITGLAQSMGFRGEISEFHQMNSRVRLDRFYLQNWSFWLDIKIIAKTVISLYKGQELAY